MSTPPPLSTRRSAPFTKLYNHTAGKLSGLQADALSNGALGFFHTGRPGYGFGRKVVEKAYEGKNLPSLSLLEAFVKNNPKVKQTYEKIRFLPPPAQLGEAIRKNTVASGAAAYQIGADVFVKKVAGGDPVKSVALKVVKTNLGHFLTTYATVFTSPEVLRHPEFAPTHKEILSQMWPTMKARLGTTTILNTLQEVASTQKAKDATKAAEKELMEAAKVLATVPK